MTTWTKDNRKKPVRSRCEAKNRTNGKRCQNFAMPNGRCRMHGGKAVPATKGSKRALKHGLYATGLLKGEKELYKKARTKLGSLDDELTMLRLKLNRAWTAQRMWIDSQEQVEGDLAAPIEEEVERPRRRLLRTLEQKQQHYRLESVETTSSKVHDDEGNPHYNISKKSIKRKQDYSAEINALSGLIGRLEMRRKGLVGDDDPTKDIVKEFRDFATDAAETLPGGSM